MIEVPIIVGVAWLAKEWHAIRTKHTRQLATLTNQAAAEQERIQREAHTCRREIHELTLTTLKQMADAVQGHSPEATS